jgi:hypothetical protein
MSFEKELKCLGFRPQTRIGECEGCKMICEECERLMIVEEDDVEEPKRKKKRNVKLVVVEQNKCFECKKKITFRRRIDHFDFCLRCAPKHEKPIEYL